MEWLIEGLVPKGFVTILYGNSGLGKSYLCKWIAACSRHGGGRSSVTRLTEAISSG